MKKVRIERHKCLAYGVCAMTQPEVFALADNEEVAQIIRQPLSDPEWQATGDAIAACPASAITLTDDE